MEKLLLVIFIGRGMRIWPDPIRFVSRVFYKCPLVKQARFIYLFIFQKYGLFQ